MLQFALISTFSAMPTDLVTAINDTLGAKFSNLESMVKEQNVRIDEQNVRIDEQNVLVCK